MFCTIDTETTGLPYEINGCYADYKESIYYDKARVIQIAWIMTKEDKLIKTSDFLVKLDGIKIENSHIHGITDEMCKEKGVDMGVVVNELYNDLKDCKLIIGQNIHFDFQIIKSEMYRYGKNIISENLEMAEKAFLIIDYLDKIQKFCTLHTARAKYGLTKYPKLIDLHRMLLGTDFDGMHQAINDVLACHRCFLKMVYGTDLIV